MTRTTIRKLTTRSFFPGKESVENYIIDQLRDYYASERQIMMEVESDLFRATQDVNGWGEKVEPIMTKEQADVELKKAKKLFKQIRREGDAFWERIEGERGEEK